jgi:hypothetical protein
MLPATYALAILSRSAMNKPQSDASSRTVKAVRVADYIVDRLAKEGIEHCLALPAIMCFGSATRLTVAQK